MDPILLTGASGYLGGCALARGRARGLDLLPLPGRLEELPPASLAVAAVIHCAGALRHRTGQWDRANRGGMAALLRGLRNPVPFLFVSSRGVYAAGSQEELDESAPTGAEDGYGASKLAAEALLRDSGCPFVVFRPTALFGLGAGQLGSSFPAEALRRMLAGLPVTLHAPDRSCDHLDVAALADLLLQALVPGPHWGETFHVAGPRRSLHALIRQLGRCVEIRTGVAPVLEVRPGPPPRAAPMSIRKLQAFFPSFHQAPDTDILDAMVEAALAAPRTPGGLRG